MGRRLSPEEIYNKVRANGYKYASHEEEDSKRIDTTYVPETIRDQKFGSKALRDVILAF